MDLRDLFNDIDKYLNKDIVVGLEIIVMVKHLALLIFRMVHVKNTYKLSILMN